MLAAGQKKALHSAARQAGVTEPQRRMIQRNAGGFHSAADATATRYGFIRVMAHYEEMCGGRLRRCTLGYWAAEAKAADPLDALRYAIGREAGRLGWRSEQVDRFLGSEHMSSGRCCRVVDAPAYWLHRLLSGLKAMQQRNDDGQRTGPSTGH